MDMQEDTGATTPEELKKGVSFADKVQKLKKQRDQEIEDIFTGKDDRLILIIGPCSADREDSVLDYMNRLAVLQEKVRQDFMIPRVLIDKPYKGGLDRGCYISHMPKRIC